VNWEEALPYLVVGGIVLAVILATRPAPPLVVGGPSQPSPEDERARLEAATRLAEIAVQRDIARYQVEASLKQYEAEKYLREKELEAEKRRAELEADAAKKAADSQFWGSFWGGLFSVVGSGLALFAGLSEPVLYDRAFYRPDRGSGGQLLALRRG
jgi:hypothetical protein